MNKHDIFHQPELHPAISPRAIQIKVLQTFNCRPKGVTVKTFPPLAINKGDHDLWKLCSNLLFVSNVIYQLLVEVEDRLNRYFA